MLPRVKIFFENGALGKVVTPADGVLGLLCTAVAVSTTFSLATPYVVRNMDMVAALGITSTNNPHLYKTLNEYYAEAGYGAEIWLMGFPDTVKLSEMVDVTDNAKGKALVNAANGRLRGLIITRKPAVGYTPTITNGLDADVALAATNGMALRAWSIEARYAPVFVLIEGYAYNGNPVDLADLKIQNKNGVAILIGDTLTASKNAAMGVLAGRVASNPVQRNIGRVKDGALQAPAIFIGDKAAENADVESIHNKGYITFRTFIGRSGYFFADDHMATSDTDDYSNLTAIRTGDKAYRIAYDTMLEELLDNIPVTTAGTVQLPIVKSWQSKVESDIAAAMTANGELSADANDSNDRGVKCFIDHEQNIIADSVLNVQTRVRPFGYPRYINVYLGFQVINA